MISRPHFSPNLNWPPRDPRSRQVSGWLLDTRRQFVSAHLPAELIIVVVGLFSNSPSVFPFIN